MMFVTLLKYLCLFYMLDTRFATFFGGPIYYSALTDDLVNSTSKNAICKADFNYDVVIQSAINESILARTR